MEFVLYIVRYLCIIRTAVRDRMMMMMTIKDDGQTTPHPLDRIVGSTMIKRTIDT